MTKGDIKTYATAKLGIADATALAQADTFAMARWAMIWNAALWRQSRYQTTQSVAAGTQDVALDPLFEFVTAARWADAQELLPMQDWSAFAADPAGYGTAGSPVSFIPLPKTSAGLAQIRLTRIPETAQNLLVLGKRKVPALTTDADAPLIPGVDECLVAFVMGDLYQWLRQLGRAQVFFEEGAALLGRMVEIETAQTSEIRRIIPIEQMLEV